MLMYWRILSADFNTDMQSPHLFSPVSLHRAGHASSQQKPGTDFLDQFLFCFLWFATRNPYQYFFREKKKKLHNRIFSEVLQILGHQ